MIPSVFDALQEDFQLDAVHLAVISPTRAMVLYLLSPIFGYLADTRSRTPVMVIGVFFWGVCTVAMASASSYYYFLACLVGSGMGMAVVTPLTYSFLADYHSASELGGSIGWLGFSSVIGGLLGVVVPTAMRNVTIGTMSSWRLVFFSNACVILVVAFLCLAAMREPPRRAKVAMTGGHLTFLVKNATFWLVVFQGFCGSLSWDVIYFLLLWFHCMGIDHWQAAGIFFCCCAGAAAGGLFGGYMGDWSSRWSPRRGRLLVSQGFVFVGLPLGIIFFAIVPTVPSSIPIYMGLGVLFGFSIASPAAACVLPIVNEVVPSCVAGTAFAIDRFVEGGSTAIGSMSVGFLARHLGYKGKDFCDASRHSLGQMQGQARSLGKALAVVMVVPWVLYFLVFFVLYWTYPYDREQRDIVERRDTLLATGEVSADSVEIVDPSSGNGSPWASQPTKLREDDEPMTSTENPFEGQGKQADLPNPFLGRASMEE